MNESQKINLFCILEDIQQSLLLELKPELRHSMKLWAGKTLDASRMFIKSIDKNIKATEAFGNAADELRDKIEEFILP